MTTLVIVESPGKVKKLKSLLGPDYNVAASVGHVRDLPLKEIGVSLPSFRPQYQPTERGRDVLARLRKATAGASRVLLATDPDREGEAIAWHLAEALNLREPRRITFNAITEDVVAAAVAAPRPLDLALVRAQEARRVLDRLVGYMVSPALSERAQERLSAGRVQTPAVRLVVDREREIAAFKPTQHFGVTLFFSGGWFATWDTKPHLPKGVEYLTDRDLAERVAQIRDVKIRDFEDSEGRQGPSAPFTTSTLQQAASARLKFKPKKTMDLAQSLYEQGAITYHRTDSPNLSDEGVADIIAYARRAGLPLSPKRRTWKAKDGAQEGHEAIRPTHCADTEAGETDDERALYRLIWARAVASQLADALFAVRTAHLLGVMQGQEVVFIARGRTLTDPGWKAVYADDKAESDDTNDDDNPSTNPIPPLTVGSHQRADGGRVVGKITKPPPRYKLATLVKELEARGIGRPSTYAAILENITSRGYILEDKKAVLSPSPTGCKIVDALVGTFGFADLDYTSALETELDLIAGRRADYQAVLTTAHAQLVNELQRLGQLAPAASYPCPDCGKPLRRRPGKSGYFWGCTGYPDCSNTLPDDKGRPGTRGAPGGPPTKAMLQFARTLAACKNILVPSDAAKEFAICKAFIDEHQQAQPDSGGDWLLAKAQRLATALGVPLPAGTDADPATLKRFVENAGRQVSKSPASNSQMSWVRKFVDQGAVPPAGYPDQVTKEAASKFVDAHMPKKTGTATTPAAPRRPQPPKRLPRTSLRRPRV